MNGEIELPYGRRSIKFACDEARFSVVTKSSDRDTPLNDFEVGAAFDSPIASSPLDEIAGSVATLVEPAFGINTIVDETTGMKSMDRPRGLC